MIFALNIQTLSVETARLIPDVRAGKRVACARAVEIASCNVQTTTFNFARGRTTLTKPPADCTTKEDVRSELDRIDQALLTLFAERHRYVTRMAEIKTDPHEAHDPVRINAILQKQRKRADELGLDEDQAELIWRTLIDWNVNYEKGIIVARRGTKS
jgi:isochorismate pyruvate lyase